MSKRKFTGSNFNNIPGKPRRRQILLSISILVSGRMETMERCIASLDRLRERVPCELILTDTGCPGEMREWLKQRADKVLRFPWCNDFAAARNVGLRAAAGAWFMFMDDDEWFEDTVCIENFFLTGEYRRYQSASYIVRNYTNMEGTEWRDTMLTRMTVRRSETRFFYPIHESLWPLLDPEKHLDDYAHHYGYANSDPEAVMAKRRRNLDILLPAIERDSHCMKHYLQAVGEYYAMDDYESACGMADAGIANCIPGREENAVHIDGLYAAAVRMRLRGKKSLEVVRIGRDYLENADISDLAKASICSDLAIAYGELGEDRICLKYLWEYLKWKKYFAEHREAWLKQETVVLDSCFENFQYRKTMGWGLAACLALGDAQGAEELLADGDLTWWMDAARHWYVMASEQRREKWQEDFQSLCNRLDVSNQLGRRPHVLAWEEDGALYSHLGQLYGILTVAVADDGTVGADADEAAGQSQESGDSSDAGIVQSQESGDSSDAGIVQSQEFGDSSDVGIVQSQESGDGSDVEVAQSQESEGGSGTAGQTVQENQDSAPIVEVTPEMEALATQMKEKIRLLIQQGQQQAALTVITQLQGFFPGDHELAQLRERCMA